MGVATHAMHNANARQVSQTRFIKRILRVDAKKDFAIQDAVLRGEANADKGQHIGKQQSARRAWQIKKSHVN